MQLRHPSAIDIPKYYDVHEHARCNACTLFAVDPHPLFFLPCRDPPTVFPLVDRLACRLLPVVTSSLFHVLTSLRSPVQVGQTKNEHMDRGRRQMSRRRGSETQCVLKGVQENRRALTPLGLEMRSLHGVRLSYCVRGVDKLHGG
jgi:hypothetical protein